MQNLDIDIFSEEDLAVMCATPFGFDVDSIVEILNNHLRMLQTNDIGDMEDQKLDKMEEEVSNMLRNSGNLWQENFRLKRKITTMNREQNELEGSLYEMEKDVSEMDQYRRRENIEIIGIPTAVKDEQLLETVLKILRNIGLWDIQTEDIVHCGRLPKDLRQKYPSVFVRFAERKHAIQTHELKRKLRYIEQRLGFKSLHIVDNLCPSYKQVFEKCQELRDVGAVAKVWTHKGVVNFKVGQGNDRPVKVFHLTELKEQFGGVDEGTGGGEANGNCAGVMDVTDETAGA